MKLVSNHSVGQTPQEISTLTKAESDHIVQYWLTPASERSVELRLNAGQIMKDAKTKELWIQCDCKSPRHVSIVYNKGNQTYHLRRLTNRDQHDKDCPFIFDDGYNGSANGGAKNYGTNLVRLPKTLSLLIKEPVGQAKASKGHGGKVTRTGKRGGRRDALQTILFWVYQKAGLHIRTATTHARSKTASITLLSESLNSTVAGNDLTFGQFAWYSDKALRQGWIHTKLKRLAESNKWPQGITKHGYLFVTAKVADTSTNTIELTNGERIVVKGKIAIFGRSGECSGPYMAIIRCKVSDDFTSTEPDKAYLHPIYSGSDIFIVDSNLERQALGVIDSFLNSQADKGLHYECVKPLEDMEVRTPVTSKADEVQGVRPDFVVRYQGCKQQILIETMGSIADEYLDRKEHVHGLMKTLGYLFLDNRNTRTPTEANKDLHKALWRWYNYQNKSFRD